MFKKIINITLIIVLLFISHINIVYAQSNDNKPDTLQNLVDTLNKDTNTVFTQYSTFIEELNSDSNTNQDIIEKLRSNVTQWGIYFSDSYNVYSKHVSNKDKIVQNIANLGVSYSQNGLDACKSYLAFLNAETEEEAQSLIAEGDRLMNESFVEHDQAVEVYNEYTGINDYLLLRDILMVISFISVIVLIVLFFKSKKHSYIQGEVIKSQIYKNLRNSCLWMTGGLIATTIGLSTSLSNGGTYYIFYGPIIIGGWQFAKGLYKYLTEGRKTLNELSKSERYSAFKDSLMEIEKDESK